jgi:hypothetical protein
MTLDRGKCYEFQRKAAMGSHSGTRTTPSAVKAGDMPFSPAADLEGNLPLPRTFGRLPLYSSAALLGCWLIALISVFSVLLLPTSAATGPFADFSGNWSGTGTVRPGSGATERIRCTASYRQRGSTQHEVDLQLRCASDSYNFDLSGRFTTDERNEITGQWTEHSRNIGGTAIGSAQGTRLDVHVESAAFAADLVMVTHNRRQSVTIDSQGGGQIVKASITLSRN